METEQTNIAFDMSFRPESYLPAGDLRTMLLSRIPGRVRREIVERLLEEGRADELDTFLLAENLEEGTRNLWGGLDPQNMGGEYLPELKEHEVEIARVEMKSTTSDVISVRARKTRSGWSYRGVDEYESEIRFRRRTSKEPLTMGELIAMIDTAELGDVEDGFVFDIIVSGCGDYLEEMADFVKVSSVLYPQLTDYYECAIKDWLRRRFPEFEDNKDEDEKESDTE